MKGSKRKSNKEKIFSAIISCGIIMTLVYGIYSVATTAGSSDNENNIVNLDAVEDNDVAIRTEDGPEEYPEVLDLRQANAGAKSEGLAQEKEDTLEEESSIHQEMIQPIEEEADKNSEEDEAAKTEAQAANSKNVAAKYSFNENDTLSWPVKGDVVLKYSMDTTIYFKTLGVYKCNPAISIAAAAGTNVGVAADGVVENVSYSEETGNTVTVSIGDGYVTTYGLLENIVVKQGDTVVAGQLLGTVAQPTAYYTQEGSNLYFMLTKDGEAIDPVGYFGEE